MRSATMSAMDFLRTSGDKIKEFTKEYIKKLRLLPKNTTLPKGIKKMWLSPVSQKSTSKKRTKIRTINTMTTVGKAERTRRVSRSSVSKSKI